VQGRRGREEVVKGGREDDEIKGSRGHIMRGKDGENLDEIQWPIILCVPCVHAWGGVYAWMLQ
jgi:hypothetical protein